MKVKFLKSHDVYSEGDTDDLPQELANYLIRCMVAEEYSEAKPKKQTKEFKQDLETK